MRLDGEEERPVLGAVLGQFGSDAENNEFDRIVSEVNAQDDLAIYGPAYSTIDRRWHAALADIWPRFPAPTTTAGTGGRSQSAYNTAATNASTPAAAAAATRRATAWQRANVERHKWMFLIKSMLRFKSVYLSFFFFSRYCSH